MVTEVEFSSVTGATRRESPKKNWRSIGYVEESDGYLKKRGWRIGVPTTEAVCIAV